jgi:hypothetical protein
MEQVATISRAQLVPDRPELICYHKAHVSSHEVVSNGTRDDVGGARPTGTDADCAI